MNRLLVLLTAGALTLSVAACGGAEVAGVPTPTDGPTPTVVPSAAVAQPTIEAQPSPTAETLDLVLLADSGGAGVADRYAALASEALGRQIRVHDHHSSGATAPEILQGVRHAWADDVAEAELVVFYVHPGGFTPESHLTCLEALDAVTGDPDYTGPAWSPGMRWDAPAPTSVQDWQGYRDALDAIYAEIWKLRAGRPTIVRAYGVWMPWLSQWRQVGIESACTANEEAIDQVRREAAEAAGAVYVSALDVFNGPAHDVDPVENGWIAEDGMHLSGPGTDVLVAALGAAGWEWSEPPSEGEQQ